MLPRLRNGALYRLRGRDYTAVDLYDEAEGRPWVMALLVWGDAQDQPLDIVYARSDGVLLGVVDFGVIGTVAELTELEAPDAE